MSINKYALNTQNKVLEYLQGYEENDLTNKVLIPLFSELGYDDVHFHGGSYEEGKDFIAVKENVFGRTEISVCQVKKLKSTRNLVTRKDFQTLIYQIRQCYDNEIKYKDGNVYFPSDVIFITPYVLETRLIEEQFANINVRTSNKVIIIDGAKLFSLLLNHLPSFVESIVGIEGEISSTIPTNISNIGLINALCICGEISNFYCDLNFVVGNIDSNVLLNSKIRYSNDFVFMDKDEWNNIKPLLRKINNKAGYDFFVPSIIEVEIEYDHAYTLYTSEENTLRTSELKIIEGRFNSNILSIGVQSQHIEMQLSTVEAKMFDMNDKNYKEIVKAGDLNRQIKLFMKDEAVRPDCTKKIASLHQKINAYKDPEYNKPSVNEISRSVLV